MHPRRKLYIFLLMSDKKSALQLFRLRYPDGTRDFFLGVDADLSPEELKKKYPQLHEFQIEQLGPYRLPARPEP